jgi:hypothetical protein
MKIVLEIHIVIKAPSNKWASDQWAWLETIKDCIVALVKGMSPDAEIVAGMTPEEK